MSLAGILCWLCWTVLTTVGPCASAVMPRAIPVPLAAWLSAAEEPPPRIVVNGRPLSAAEWEFLRLTRGENGALTPERRVWLIDHAIERALIRGFLSRRKITPPSDAVEFQIRQLEDLIRRRGEQPDPFLARLGLTREVLQQELGLSLAWQVYVQQAASDRQIQQYFEEHRSELDGTRVRVRQIFRKVPSDAADSQSSAAEQLLLRLKRDIEAGRLSFAEAAQQHSQSPSGQQGGDVGWVGAPGKLPAELTSVVLTLQPGEIAGPLRTAFGWHLVQVTERKAGQLSLEDARPVILDRLSVQWWQDVVAKERAAANISRSE